MFIKLGQEKHLKDLYQKGEMYFSSCKKFQQQEKEIAKGIGDVKDGRICLLANEIVVINHYKKEMQRYKNLRVNNMIDGTDKIPVYCIMRTEDEHFSIEEIEKIKKEFPYYTHALVIYDENSFLENIRYHFKSRAFAHTVFYENDYITTDFYDFIKNGESDISFYVPQGNRTYFAHIFNEPFEGPREELYIDKSNVYKTIYRKNTFFETEKEYRITLPYEKIDRSEGRKYYIAPFEAELLKIDELVKN